MKKCPVVALFFVNEFYVKKKVKGILNYVYKLKPVSITSIQYFFFKFFILGVFLNGFLSIFERLS